MDDPWQFDARLHTARALRGLSQAQLGERGFPGL